MKKRRRWGGTRAAAESQIRKDWDGLLMKEEEEEEAPPSQVSSEDPDLLLLDPPLCGLRTSCLCASVSQFPVSGGPPGPEGTSGPQTATHLQVESF